MSATLFGVSLLLIEEVEFAGIELLNEAKTFATCITT